MAILGSKERKLVLSDIYQWILDNYPYFRRRGPGWRNSIRHNLSLNDCFVKAGRSANGKGHYWAIHPANVEDFERGDFRRRRAQRKVRRAMGLSVADDDDDSPIPSPSTPAMWTQFRRPEEDLSISSEPLELRVSTDQASAVPVVSPPRRAVTVTRKRLFDVESLLAPDADKMSNKPEIMAPGPEIASTTGLLRQRDEDCYGVRVYPVSSPDRKRRAVSPKVDEDDVIMVSRQPMRAVVCDDNITTTSGSVSKPIVDDERDAVKSPNPLPGRKSVDSDETGSRFASTRRCVDAEATLGICAESEAARFWLRHANMATSRLARAFFPIPPAAYHLTCMNADVGQARDINQGRCNGQGQRQSHEGGKGQGQELILSQVRGQNEGHVQGQGRGQFEGQEMVDFKGLPSPIANEKNAITSVDVNKFCTEKTRDVIDDFVSG